VLVNFTARGFWARTVTYPPAALPPRAMLIEAVKLYVPSRRTTSSPGFQLFFASRKWHGVEMLVDAAYAVDPGAPRVPPPWNASRPWRSCSP
jgi:hypothetical protein